MCEFGVYTALVFKCWSHQALSCCACVVPYAKGSVLVTCHMMKPHLIGVN